jgi:hypothetical protein
VAPTSTSTTLVTGDAVCVGGGTIARAVVKLGRLRGDRGDETFAITGTIVPPAGAASPLEPAVRGLQVLLEDLGAAAPMIALTAATTPVPAGAPGTGCDSRDGWRKQGYRNRSGALPPGCAPGSAQGLRRVRLEDRRARGGGVDVAIGGRGATLDPPMTPLRITVVLGEDPAAGLAGACASHTFGAGSCKAKRGVVRCK